MMSIIRQFEDLEVKIVIMRWHCKNKNIKFLKFFVFTYESLFIKVGFMTDLKDAFVLKHLSYSNLKFG